MEPCPTVSVVVNSQLNLYRSEEQLYRDIVQLPGVQELKLRAELPHDFVPQTAYDVLCCSARRVRDDLDVGYQPLNVSELELTNQRLLPELIGNWLPALHRLDLTGCTNLRRLNLYGCPYLSSLTLTRCTNLRFLDVRLTALTSLDVSDCPPTLQLLDHRYDNRYGRMGYEIEY